MRTGTDRRGFTLLEVLVALTLLAVVLSVVMQIFSTGLRGLAATDARHRLVMEAEGLLARAAADLDPSQGPRDGTLSDGSTWVVRREPWIEKEPQRADAPSF